MDELGKDLLADRLATLALGVTDLVQAISPMTLRRESSAAVALRTVFEVPGLRIDQLAGMLAMSHSGTGRLVDRLVEENLVERRPHALDRRSVSLHVSRAGRKLATECQARRIQSLRTLIDGLSETDRRELARIADALLARLADTAARVDDLRRPSLTRSSNTDRMEQHR